MATNNLQVFSASVTSRRHLDWIVFFVALATSLAYSAHFLPAYTDDAFISYRYSERLLHGQGLTWNDGEHVEGYSNLLWVLLVAAGGLIHSNLIVVGWTLGLLANAATLGAFVWAFRTRSVGFPLPLAGGLLVISLSSAVAYWSAAGLETPLLDALLAWALALTYRPPGGSRKWVSQSLLLGLLAISRVDGILFTAGIYAGVVLYEGIHGNAWRRSLRLWIFPIAFVAAQIGFRLFYYGTAVPNTAYAKLAFTSERILSGTLYLRHAALSSIVPLAVVLTLALLIWRSRALSLPRQLWVAICPAILWSVYVNVIGGDHFEYYRHWMPVLVCLAFALSVLLTAIPPIDLRKLAVLVVLATGLYVGTQASVDPFDVPYIKTAQTEDLNTRGEKAFPGGANADPMVDQRRVIASCLEFGQFLHDAFGRQRALVAVINAGCIPYGSQLPALDMLGLNDSYIAHHRPSDMGKGRVAHELGNGAYVISRRPDLVVFCGPPSLSAVAPCFRGELELAARPEFRSGYRLVFVKAGNTDAAVWVRSEAGRIGIARDENRIWIPGFLLASEPGTRAVLAGGRLVTALQTGDASLRDVYLPPGTWEVSLETGGGSQLQFTTSPEVGSTLIQPDVLRVSSVGGLRSFRVFGGSGVIYAITARRIVG